MSFKEVNNLRKEGKLNEAYDMAKADLSTESDNIWAKRAMSWVLYAYLKANVDIHKVGVFKSRLAELKALNLPAEEEMVFNQLAWQIGVLVFKLAADPGANQNAAKGIFELIRDFNFTRPGDAFSFLLKAFHKVLKDTPDYVTFIEWWGLENLMPENYEKEKLENGNEIMSLAEQVYIAFSKQLLHSKTMSGDDSGIAIAKESISAFIPKIDQIIDQHPEYQYPPYYKAKLLLELGDKENSLSAIIPFARKKQNDFWVWDVLSDSFATSDERKFACLCRAMLCNAPDSFLINTRQKLIVLLIDKKFYSEARTEIEKIIQTRTDQNWPIPQQLVSWTKQPWYNNAKANNNNFALYKTKASMANEILFADIPEQLIAVEWVNHDKKILNFVGKEKWQGYFKYDRVIRKVKIGDVLSVRLQKANQEGRNNVHTLKKMDDTTLEGVIKSFTGKVVNPFDKPFGFVNDIFIPPDIYGKHKLKDRDEISGRAILSFNKRKEEWGWKVIKID